MYRLNYGNGQVSRNLDSLKEARFALRRQKEYSERISEPDSTYIQKYVGDDAPDGWIRVKEEKSKSSGKLGLENWDGSKESV